jgi:hypothetical protein
VSTNTPATIAFFGFAPKDLCNKLVSKTNSDELLPGLMQGLNEGPQLLNPRLIFINTALAARNQITITNINFRRILEVLNIVNLNLTRMRVRAKNTGKHIGVIAMRALQVIEHTIGL